MRFGVVEYCNIQILEERINYGIGGEKVFLSKLLNVINFIYANITLPPSMPLLFI